jgi:hypothetical protein
MPHSIVNDILMKPIEKPYRVIFTSTPLQYDVVQMLEVIRQHSHKIIPGNTTILVSSGRPYKTIIKSTSDTPHSNIKIINLKEEIDKASLRLYNGWIWKETDGFVEKWVAVNKGKIIDKYFVKNKIELDPIKPTTQVQDKDKKIQFISWAIIGLIVVLLLLILTSIFKKKG